MLFMGRRADGYLHTSPKTSRREISRGELSRIHCKMSQLIFFSSRDTEDETTTQCTCVNDINAKLQIRGMSHYHRCSSMRNWDSFSSSAARKDCNGPGAQGRNKSPRLDLQTHTALLSAYFYHPFHHKGGNYTHFSAQPQLLE